MTSPRILPGDKFTIEYGGGKQIEVVALAGKRQRELGKILDELRQCEQTQEIERMCDLAEQALAYCMDKETAARMWETDLDAELAMEIAGGTFAKQSLDLEEVKK